MTAKRKLLAATMFSCLLTLISILAPASEVRADGGLCRSYTECTFGCQAVTFPSQCEGAEQYGYCADGCE